MCACCATCNFEPRRVRKIRNAKSETKPKHAEEKQQLKKAVASLSALACSIFGFRVSAWRLSGAGQGATMSLFKTTTLACPHCGTKVDFEAVVSVNADRRPDLRAAILDGSFQRQDCPQCGRPFRLDPELTYMDVGRGQWLAVFPVAQLPRWPEAVERVQATFAASYRNSASPGARALAERLTPRVVFGWAALSEKLVAADAQLDDVILELAKAALLRGLPKPPVGLGTELRLVEVRPDQLVVAWIRAASESAGELLEVPRTLYDDIAAAPAAWEALRATLADGPFVDLNKLLVPTLARADA